MTQKVSTQQLTLSGLIAKNILGEGVQGLIQEHLLATENSRLSPADAGAVADRTGTNKNAQTDVVNNGCIGTVTGDGNVAGNGTCSLTGSYKNSLKSRVSAKMPKGWHFTEKYGEVYVSPGGIAWVVQRQGNKLESVSVPLTKDNIIGKTAIEKRADAIRNQTRRAKSKVTRTQTPILTPSVAEVVVGKMAEVVK